MKKLITILAFITEVILLPQAIADSSVTSEIKSNKSNQALRMPMYQPPRRGAPNIRVGGGTRGISGEVPSIHVLAPDHVGLTDNEQPTLSWYMSKSNPMRLEILVIDEEGIEPLLELTLKPSDLNKGMHSIDLAKHGVKLKSGVKYQWSVIMVAEEGRRSGDIVSSGMIERRKLTNALQAKLKKASSHEDVFIYAQEGYWYDAISKLTGLIKKNPDNETLKEQHAQLLSQIGLSNLK